MRFRLLPKHKGVFYQIEIGNRQLQESLRIVLAHLRNIAQLTCWLSLPQHKTLCEQVAEVLIFIFIDL